MNGSTKVSVVALSWLTMWAWLYVVPNDGNHPNSAAASDNPQEQKAYTGDRQPDPFEVENTAEIATAPITAPKPQPASVKAEEERQAAAAKLKADYHKPESIALKAELDRVNQEIGKIRVALIPKVVPLPLVKPKAVKAVVKPNFVREQVELAAAQTKVATAQRRYQLAQEQFTITPLPEWETQIVADNRADRQPSSDFDMLTGRVMSPILAAQALAEPIGTIIAKKPPAVEQSSRTKEIQTELANAQHELEAAQAGLTAVMEKHQRAQLDWQMAELDRLDRSHKAELDRVKQIEFTNLKNHDREYQIAQLQLRKIHLESQIAELAAVNPSGGTVQQVKTIAREGNLVRYEVGIMYTQATVQPRADSIAVPRWQEDK